MVTNMRFDEEPNYSKLISLFDGSIALNVSQRPIRTDGVAKFGQKRGRSLVELEDGGQPRKNVRSGSPVSQWISVFNYRSAMKQSCWCMQWQCLGGNVSRNDFKREHEVELLPTSLYM
ncbi:casein kinase 1-like protein HD16 [Humulus lupulus]|uniref:casein kinase 1-like protein HD16 n=1 Tax=Humulus lupulus TaxID=3486 RepID=UPI002B408336|nr:casein kinase 1-like protein HD16 [Humulus lupulus]